MNAELEKLIALARQKGNVTENQKAVILRKAESLGEDLDEVELILDNIGMGPERKKEEDMGNADNPSPVSLQDKPKKKVAKKVKVEKEKAVKKCPHCGAPILDSLATKCSECGYVFSGTSANRILQNMTEKIEKIQNTPYDEKEFGGGVLGQFAYEGWKKEEKASIIKNTVIPNNREDLLEFVTAMRGGFLASTLGSNEYNAYKQKYLAVIEKIRFLYNDDPKFKYFIEDYQKIIKADKKRIAKQNIGNTIAYIALFIFAAAIIIAIIIFG